LRASTEVLVVRRMHVHRHRAILSDRLDRDARKGRKPHAINQAKRRAGQRANPRAVRDQHDARRRAHLPYSSQHLVQSRVECGLTAQQTDLRNTREQAYLLNDVRRLSMMARPRGQQVLIAA